MGTWRMDRKTAIYLAEHIMEMPESFPLEHCDECDSDYLKEVGHEHDDYIDFETHEVTEEDKVEPIKMTPKSYEVERDEVWDSVMDMLKH